MNIIPVIDLKDGQVVAAQQGQRENYRPIRSQLCRSSSIEDVVDSYLNIYPFHTLYIADLNAITGNGNNEDLINSIIRQHSTIDFWVDKGLTNTKTATSYRTVIGTEKLDSEIKVNFSQSASSPILSLDFFPEQGYTGPKELLNNPQLWPKNIIIMTLDKVGKKQGPDFKRLSYFQQQTACHNIIAAGGIRHLQDLISLKKINIHSALVASALHSGEINRKAIKKLIPST